MNIMLTSVGRRAYMIKFFKQVLGVDGEVHVCNSDDMTVAFHYADHAVISPLIYDKNYIPFLLDYCRENRIDLLLSLFDIDLLMLARHKQAFADIGTQVIVSEPEFVAVCNDKWLTHLYLKERGFHVPKTYLSLQETMKALERGEISYPVIVKPRFGCGSIAMSVAEDEMALLYYFSRNNRTINRSYLRFESDAVEEKIIFQEMLPGQEYGVDIINDLQGNFRNAIVKKKIAMRAGETDIAELVEEPVIWAEARRLGQYTGHIANMDCDFFLVDGVPYVLEMNARFGGGYPFSHMGGCDLPRAIVQWAKGESVPDEMLTAQTGFKAYKELGITKV